MRNWLKTTLQRQNRENTFVLRGGSQTLCGILTISSLYDRRWFIAYMDDASRFIVGFGIFDEATTENALKVLESAIKMHGKPAQILTDHGSQFYANEKEATKRGESDF